jgi:hypothetical protein
MYKQEAREEYLNAQKAGHKEYKEAGAAKKPKHPSVLDELLVENDEDDEQPELLDEE